MQLMRLGKSTLRSVTARVITRGANTRNKSVMYFTVTHGSAGEGLHQVRFAVDKYVGLADKPDDTLQMQHKDYNIFPIRREGKHIKDRNNNNIYCIYRDSSSEMHANDYLIFWDIPNDFYKSVKYDVSGNVAIISEGYNGKVREDSYVSPAPVLEVTGDCKLAWTGVNNNGQVITQIITFTEGVWDVGEINVSE